VNFRRGWIYVLIVSLTTISYIDRTALSVAAKDIATEFHLSPVQMGYLFSSFIWTYVLFLLPMGILIDRYSAKRVAVSAIGLWSVTIALTIAAWNFASLLALRLALGAAESSVIPASGRIAREWIPARERGVIWASNGMAISLGTAVGALIIGTVSSAYGWRVSFVVIGALGFVWLIPTALFFDRPERVKWLSAAERTKIVAERGTDADSGLDERGRAATLFRLAKSRSIWGVVIAQSAAIYTTYTLLYWLPTYLQTTKNLSIMSTGLFSAVPWAISIPLSISIGLLSDRLLTGEGLLAGRRRSVIFGAMLCSTVIFLVPFADDLTIILALFAVSLTGVTATLALNGALVTDLLHNPRDIGKAISMLVFGGNAFGILAPIITGYVVQNMHKFDWAFWIAGILLFIGAAAVFTMTRRPIVTDDAPVVGAGRDSDLGYGRSEGRTR
jgi:MFS family permease